jgi:hypothetical protein
LFYDKSCLIHSALDRSNGASFGRGTLSRDSVDFLKSSFEERRLPASPYPEMFTVTNGVIHEYEAARQVYPEASFPPVDHLGLYRRLVREVEAMRPSEHRDAMRSLLGRYRRDRPILIPYDWFWRGVGKLRTTLRGPLQGRSFPSTVEALAFAKEHPRERGDPAHLSLLAPRLLS